MDLGFQLGRIEGIWAANRGVGIIFKWYLSSTVGETSPPDHSYNFLSADLVPFFSV